MVKKENKKEESIEDFVDTEFDFSFLDNKSKLLEKEGNKNYNLNNYYNVEITDNDIITEIFPDIEVEIVKCELATCKCNNEILAKRYSKAFNKWIYPIICDICNKPLKNRIIKTKMVNVRSDTGKIIY
jgi:hypothetical protein